MQDFECLLRSERIFAQHILASPSWYPQIPGNITTYEAAPLRCCSFADGRSAYSSVPRSSGRNSSSSGAGFPAGTAERRAVDKMTSAAHLAGPGHRATGRHTVNHVASAAVASSLKEARRSNTGVQRACLGSRGRFSLRHLRRCRLATPGDKMREIGAHGRGGGEESLRGVGARGSRDSGPNRRAWYGTLLAQAGGVGGDAAPEGRPACCQPAWDSWCFTSLRARLCCAKYCSRSAAFLSPAGLLLRD